MTQKTRQPGWCREIRLIQRGYRIVEMRQEGRGFDEIAAHFGIATSTARKAFGQAQLEIESFRRMREGDQHGDQK